MHSAYLFFHCNLEFSSIPEADRGLVIERCYQPMLDIAERLNIPIGIELTGLTLEHIAELSPSWVKRFQELLHQGKCELIGSGYAQVIGPLVPAELTRWNLELGLETYQLILQHTPRLALINEMAFSAGILDLYLDAGFKGVIVDRRNLPYPQCPNAIASASGQRVPLLWADSILFQRLQRYVHGELGEKHYLEQLETLAAKFPGPIPVYSSDGEIFDYRPARFHSEAHIQGGEWPRFLHILAKLTSEKNYRWLSPSQAFAELQTLAREFPAVTSAKMPIPCKKQAKYQVSRWAISGRNDLCLNTSCHRLLAALTTQPSLRRNHDAWRLLCKFWGSDFRTHIEEGRWQKLQQELTSTAQRWQVRLPPSPQAEEAQTPPAHEISFDGPSRKLPAFVERLAFNSEHTLVEIATTRITLVLSLKRGLAIESLSFRSHGFIPLMGSLHQGYFDEINVGVDYYSGSTVIELPRKGRKITDLVAVAPRFSYHESKLFISTSICTELGLIEKTLCLDDTEETLAVTTGFAEPHRPFGSVRLNALTLLSDQWNDGDLTVTMRNGGRAAETFPLFEAVRHDQAINCVVSNTTGLGATDGRLEFRGARKGLLVQWDPRSAAALPMLIHQPTAPCHLTRLVFSLAELDETSREGGRLLDFTVKFAPL
jgi:hypothetical protein